ncbi:hypothetical protein AAK938_01260 [Aerococcaceae bacterium 50-4]
MKIEILTTSMTTRKQYDISNLCSPPNWTTSLKSQPGKLEFEMLESDQVAIKSGDEIMIKVNDVNIFKGRVFTETLRGKNDFLTKVIAYDQTRYLQNEDTLIFNANTLVDRFKKICQTQGIPHKVLDSVAYKCAAVLENKHTYYSMLESAIEETATLGGQRFAFWDNFGTMELFNLNRGITNLVIGDKSLMTDFTLTKTIDDSANAVKILREDKEKGKREIYSATNAKNIEKWGKLQVVETISDADLNASQLKARANELLRKKNVEIISADIDAIGDLSIRAGKSFTWRNSKTTEYGVGHDTLVLVTRCVHTISQTPTMSLEVEVIG